MRGFSHCRKRERRRSGCCQASVAHPGSAKSFIEEVQINADQPLLQTTSEPYEAKEVHEPVNVQSPRLYHVIRFLKEDNHAISILHLSEGPLALFLRSQADDP